jgi:predicted pyridoxine 5'-phosphate oxidase superfamily flavin-nucleotide-binding protein
VTTATGIASDIAFTPVVKAIQARKGSRDAYARMERAGGWSRTIDDELAAFIAAQTSVFLATANAAGQPYAQHRGGPAGFLRVLDAHTIAFADYKGNRQFISSGNLAENPKAFLFLIDYAHRQRIKIWGTARVVEDDAALVASLMPTDYKARPEQAIVFDVEAWDANCPQHIPQRFEAADVTDALAARDAQLAEKDARIRALEAELRAATSGRRAASALRDPSR